MSDLQCNFGNIGSGYRETISVLHLSDKGYKIFVIEKGNDFPKTTGNLNNIFCS